MSDTLTITIDGQKITTRKGLNLLEVASQNNYIHILTHLLSYLTANTAS